MMRPLDRMIGVLVVVAALVVPAGFTVAADMAGVIKARQDHMKAIGEAAKAIGEQLKTGMPDKAVVLAAATKIDTLAEDQMNWFPAGSGPEAGVKTAAKPEIWAQPADFKAAHVAFVVEADKLAQVAATGDAAALGAQLQATGKACGGCHKPFRVPPPPAQ